MTISAKSTVHDDITVLALSGTIKRAYDDTRRLAHIVASTAEKGCAKIILNFHLLDAFDGSVLDAVIATVVEAKLHDAKLVLAELPERLLLQFDKLKLGSHYIPVFSTEKEALAAYGINEANLLEAGRKSRALQIGPLSTQPVLGQLN